MDSHYIHATVLNVEKNTLGVYKDRYILCVHYSYLFGIGFNLYAAINPIACK